MKTKSFVVNLITTTVIGAAVLALGLINAFETLDFRLYDGMLHLKKDPPVSDKVLLLCIDDIDIDKLGDWPWSRDILGNTLIRMKELGAAAAVFDIEYISKSPLAVASNATEKINNKIYETEMLSEDLINSIPTSIERGYPVRELNSLTSSLINETLYPAYTDLYGFVENNIASDNDEYFGRACQFFGNTWLTVNTNDLGYSHFTSEYIDYIRNRLLIKTVSDPNHFIHSDNLFTFEETYNGDPIGFTPTLDTILSRGHGVGYTNSNIDSDGVRRRMELLYEYNGLYLGQLVFAPLMHVLDAKEFAREKNALIVRGALFPGEKERTDFRIPLDEHGRMLINWQHESAADDTADFRYGFTNEYVYTLYQLDALEANIISNLSRIYDEYVIFDQDGYPFDYVVEAAQLADTYNQLTEKKIAMLESCTGYGENNMPFDGITDEQYASYFSGRAAFFASLKEFCSKKYIDEINQVLDAVLTDSEEDQAYRKDFNDIFKTIENDVTLYLSNFNDEKAKFEGRYCIIGQTAASTTDIGAIPFEKQYANVGIHANVMNTILTRNFITPGSWLYGFLISFVISMISILILGLLGATNNVYNFVNGIIKIILFIAFAVLFISFDYYIPMVGGVIVFNLMEYLAGIMYRYLLSSRERRFIMQVASSFANKDTVEQLRKNPDLFKTAGEKKCITALFSDIQKFSTLSESIGKMYGDEGPTKLIEILNEYLGAMSNEILRNSGNIDKYEGDAIISMFGAPDAMNLHTPEQWAYLCLDSAIRMKKVEVEFNNTHEDLFKPVVIKNADGVEETIQLKKLQTRIGINSGDAFVGLMGSKTETFSKLNYTMIGDTVNLASRLEGVNKVYASWIMCSDTTWNLANSGENEGKLVARKLDQVRVVGKSTPVQLYNILGFKNEMSYVQLEEVELFHAALDKYLARNFVEAGKMFVQASKMIEDPTALIFAERCKNYVEKGVPANWDGVMNMTSK